MVNLTPEQNLFLVGPDDVVLKFEFTGSWMLPVLRLFIIEGFRRGGPFQSWFLVR